MASKCRMLFLGPCVLLGWSGEGTQQHPSRRASLTVQPLWTSDHFLFLSLWCKSSAGRPAGTNAETSCLVGHSRWGHSGVSAWPSDAHTAGFPACTRAGFVVGTHHMRAAALETARRHPGPAGCGGDRSVCLTTARLAGSRLFLGGACCHSLSW